MAIYASTNAARGGPGVPRRRRVRGAIALLIAVALVALGCSSGARAGGAGQQSVAPGAVAAASGAGVHHYEYVFPDGAIYVYDMDRRQRLVERVNLPAAKGIRGVAASPSTHILYVSYGGDGGGNGSGSLLAYDLLARRVLWTRHYDTGIDSMAISPDGRLIYMPSGELDASGVWNLLAANDGHVVGSIRAGAGAHNTVMSRDGRHVYLGGRNYNYLEVAETGTNKIVKRIGPLRSGVRPFTINGAETLAYTTATGFLGFQVSSIVSGRVLYTQSFPGFNWSASSFAPSAPSHGISLSPNGREVWVMDAPNSYVHVFDVSRVPAHPPRLVANVRLSRPMAGEDSPCSYDCARDGWVQHSRDGRFVYVGDSGDVINARTHRIVAYLPPLRETRKMLEIDWSNGAPVAATPREGVGYVR
jgi:DNA-binding beta-propeller fold protein YncE